MKRAYGRNKVYEEAIEAFEETWGVEPVYAQFLELVETLEVVVEWFEDCWGEVLVDVNEEMTSVR